MSKYPEIFNYNKLNRNIFMKTNKLLFAVAFAAVTLLSGYNYVQNNSEVKLSDLALANVEALANCENVGFETGRRSYLSSSGTCYCFHCPEIGDSNCNCR